ncbi:MAG: hypothetical protein DHS20C20_22510 [Ardenticatenaceae bacterium]|nr:MAG: hypothetical protein DHS20C20_22510 [Ardenticatenaceae bacterium]
MRKPLALCLLFLAILISSPVSAKGPPNKVTITHSDLVEPIEMTDSNLLDSFAMGHFVNFESPTEEPKSLQAGLEITRWYAVGETQLKAIDKFVYYSDPNGGNGTIFYEGIIDKMFIYEGSPFDGQWYQPTENGDRVMQELIAAYELSPNNTESFQLILQKNRQQGGPYFALLTVSVILSYLIYRKKVLNTLINT